MKSLIAFFGVVGFDVLSASMTQAVAQAREPLYSPEMRAKIESVPKPSTAAPLVDPANKETAVACTKCFTCGGDWPNFEGVQFTGTGQVSERGGLCAGPVGSVTNDQTPFLCCR